MGQVAFSSPLREGVYFEEVDVGFLFYFFASTIKLPLKDNKIFFATYLFIYCLNFPTWKMSRNAASISLSDWDS
jgi:hypothetical protein